MTVQTQTYSVTAEGNGSATVFSFSPMVIFASTDIAVTVVDAAGTETTLTEGTGINNYSVSVSEYPGTGSITYPATLGTELPAGEFITIKRVLTLEQTTDLENQGGYHADTQEQAMDKLVMICLQQQEELDRCLKGAVTDFSTLTSDDFYLPAKDQRANTYLGFDSVGTPQAVGELSGVTASAFMITLLDDATAAEARTTLGAGVPSTITKYIYTATGGQTVFSGADDNANTLSYEGDAYMVFLNGVMLRLAQDFTVTGGTTVTLTDGANLNDLLEVLTFSVISPETGLSQTTADDRYALEANNLSDLTNAGTARVNLKLGTASPSDGEILYWSGTGWVELAAGTSGQILQSNGAAAPTWVNNHDKTQWTLVDSAAITSGASTDLTGISTTAVELKVIFQEFSLSAGGGVVLDIRDASSGGTGGLMYIDHNGSTSRYNTGIYRAMQSGGAAIGTNHCSVLFTRMGATDEWWGEGHAWSDTGTGAMRAQSAGRIETVTTPDRIRITTSSGNFDGANGFAYLYEKVS
jgi:hypothetical protein